MLICGKLWLQTKIASEVAKLKEERLALEASHKKAVEVARNEAFEQVRVLMEKMRAEVEESKRTTLLQEKKVEVLTQKLSKAIENRATLEVGKTILKEA